jgi:NAD(P)-dependent dehydrogenase (short-subunit alcohol dehydrogenase family)
MTELLSNSTAVVTGGASGIGRRISEQLATYGADVVVADIQENPREMEESTTDLIRNKTDSETEFVQCDVTKEADIQKSINKAHNLGNFNIFVNNAGVFLDDEAVINSSREVFEDSIDVNVRGVYNGSKIAAEAMQDIERGSIINMSSINAFRPPQEASIYSLTKGAVMSFTYALAAEVGPDNTRVNCIHPGPTKTQMTTEDSGKLGTEEAREQLQSVPLRRYADPGDIANAAVFLASDLSSHVTAESLIIDGGFTNTSANR